MVEVFEISILLLPGLCTRVFVIRATNDRFFSFNTILFWKSLYEVNDTYISNFQNNKMVNLDQQVELAGTFQTGSYTANFASSGTSSTA